MTLATATPFGKMFRALRLARHWSHKKTAELTGLIPTTIGTIEGSEFRVIGPDRAVICADAFGLAGEERKTFLQLHEQTPLSQFSEERREQWRKRNDLRGKIKNFDTLKYAACELAIRFIQESPVGDACRCDFGGGSYGDVTKPCEVCFVLERVGILGGLGDQERTLMRLSKIMRELEPKVFPGPKATAK